MPEIIWKLLAAIGYMQIGYLLMLLSLYVAKKSTWKEEQYTFMVNWKSLFIFPATTICTVGHPRNLLSGTLVTWREPSCPWAFKASRLNSLSYKIWSTFFWPAKIGWLVFSLAVTIAMLVISSLAFVVYKVSTFPIRCLTKT